MSRYVKGALLFALGAAAALLGTHLYGHFMLSAQAGTPHSHSHGKPPKEATKEAKAALAMLPQGTNAVQNEMRQLLGAMNVVVASVANNDLKAIPPALHAVHEARTLTEEAIRSGAYKLPKNPDRMADFIAEDNAFHEELVKLLGAVERNDLPAATAQVGALMNGCTSCHTTYRF